MTEMQLCRNEECTCLGGKVGASTGGGGEGSSVTFCSSVILAKDCAKPQCHGNYRKCGNRVSAKIADIPACADFYMDWIQSSADPSRDQNYCIQDACKSGKVCSEAQFMEMCPLRGSSGAIRTMAFQGILVFLFVFMAAC